MKHTLLLMPFFFFCSVLPMNFAKSCFSFFLGKEDFQEKKINFAQPQHYSINLMWINRDVNVKQEYVYPSETNGGKQFLDTIVKWAEYNPESAVFLWFDSYFVSQNAVEKTQESINQQISQKNTKTAKVELKDIRLIPRIQKNAEIFCPEIPVYFRADLARAVIAENALEQDNSLYFVYTDFDVKPMKKAELFDDKTLATLHKSGFVMAHEANCLGFENSFQIFTYDEKLLKALKLMVIKANILRAESFLRDDIKENADQNNILSNPKIWKMHEVGFQENVFFSYPLMNHYFGQLKNTGKLTLHGSSEPYDQKRNGKELLTTNAKLLMTQSSANPCRTTDTMPTKKIVLPPSTSAFNELSRSR